MSSVDLYDEEVAKIGPIWQEINNLFAHKSSTQANYDELQKVVAQKFFEIGLVARVDVPTFIAEGINEGPALGAPTIEIVGRVPGSALSNSEEGVQITDHERKRHEILEANKRGEKYRGQKESTRSKKRK